MKPETMHITPETIMACSIILTPTTCGSHQHFCIDKPQHTLNGHGELSSKVKKVKVSAFSSKTSEEWINSGSIKLAALYSLNI